MENNHTLEGSQDKTDYTYSHTISYRSEANPDRRVGSPNMSRRGLRASIGKSPYQDRVIGYSRAESYSSNSMSLRSRSINRRKNANSLDSSIPDSEQSTQQRLDYGLDDSDSEGEIMLAKKYQSPKVRQENGNPTRLVTNPNGVLTQTKYVSNNYETSTVQRKRAEFTTYTADDDRPIKVFMKRTNERLVQFFYSLYNWISTIVTAGFILLKNPLVAAATFQSWSSRARPQSWQDPALVNTTSQTKVTYVKNYLITTVRTCRRYYSQKKAKSPLIWWWIPLLILLFLSLFALRWYFGEFYSEQSAALYAYLHPYIDGYDIKDHQMVAWLQSRAGEAVSLGGQVAQSIWVLLTEFAYLTVAAMTSLWSKSESVYVPENLNSKDIRTKIRVMQETQNSHGKRLVKLENQFEAEMSPIIARLEASQILSKNPSQSEDAILQLKKEQTSLLNKLEALSISVEGLGLVNKGNVGSVAEEEILLAQQLVHMSESVTNVNEDITRLKAKYATLETAMKTCCNKTYVTADDMQSHVMFVTSQMFGGFNVSLEEVRNWVRTYFVAKSDLDTRMSAVLKSYMTDITQKNEVVLETLQHTADTILRAALEELRSEFYSEKLKYQANVNGTLSNSGMSEGGFAAGYDGMWSQSKIEYIVAQMLKKYDADRTGMVDHALESAGGSVVSTRCTENYHIHYGQVYLLNIGIWKYSTNTPRSLIQPSRNPGDCWAFRGSLGYVVIELTSLVRLTGFTMEHIPKTLSPRGTIDSAPRTFSVYGLHSPNSDGYKMGNYSFLDNGEPLQYFKVQQPTSDYFKFVELKIHSNHGNNVYTCVYRFRVHGVRSTEID